MFMMRFHLRKMSNRKYDYRDALCASVLIIIPVIYALIILGNGYVIGSDKDWLPQHTVIPEYFRMLFYNTGNIFPDFAANLGAGQNIYNYAYYGMYNPLLLPAYILPFVKMSTYIQILLVIEMMADGLLCYYWLHNHFGWFSSFTASLSLMLSAPILYHSCIHIMFVDYMPFLLLGLIGCDRYFEKKKWGLVIISLVCSLLTSFYFAMGVYVVLFIYLLSCQKKEQMLPVKKGVKTVLHLIYPFLISGMLAMFYLLPMLCAILSSERGGAGSVSLMNLLAPDLSGERFLYYEYGLGMTVTALLALCTSIIYKKSRERLMALIIIGIMMIPIFQYVLNGFLYFRDKVFIPFLPLFAWLLAAYFEQVMSIGGRGRNNVESSHDNSERCCTDFILSGKKICYLRLGMGYILTAVLVVIFFVKHSVRDNEIMMLAELAVIGCMIVIHYFFNGRWILYFSIVMTVFSSVSTFQTLKDELLDRKVLETTESDNYAKLVDILDEKEDISVSRTELRGGESVLHGNVNRIFKPFQNISTIYSSVYNSCYYQFRRDIGIDMPSRNRLINRASLNPVFNRFMGVKYYISDDEPEYYDTLAEADGKYICKDNNAAPIFYLTDKVVSEQVFDSLSWKEKQLLLLHYAVLDKEIVDTPLIEDLQKRSFDFSKVTGKTVSFKDGNLHVRLKKNKKFQIHLDRTWEKDQYLFISFKVKNNKKLTKKNEILVWVNETKNKLSGSDTFYNNDNNTFHYTLATGEDTDILDLTLGKGNYVLSDFDISVANVAEYDSSLYSQPLTASVKRSGDGWNMDYSCEEDSWWITSVPYDESFAIEVDGQKTELQKVNDGFLGARVPAGKHHISVTYSAKGKTIGILISLAALVFMVILRCLKNSLTKNRFLNI